MNNSAQPETLRRGPLLSAGLLIGAGMGGFVDGILLHQILQWHHLLTGRLPANTLVNVKINMVWDGVFHAGVWLVTAAGIVALWRAGTRRDVAWSGRTFAGALCAGWGLFNLIEGLIDHEWLGLHHVIETAANHLPGDMAFLAFGAGLLGTGVLLVRAGRNDTRPRGSL